MFYSNPKQGLIHSFLFPLNLPIIFDRSVKSKKKKVNWYYMKKVREISILNICNFNIM